MVMLRPGKVPVGSACPVAVLLDVALPCGDTTTISTMTAISICNGYLHYAPPASYYPRGGYEVTECFLAPEWESIFETAVKELLTQL